MVSTASVPTPGFATEQVHAGVGPDASHGSRITPIHLTAGFVFDDFDQARDRFAGDDDGYSYTRMGNPTTSAVERKLAALEHGTEAIAVGSGQAAVSIALLALLKAGDHLLSARSIYEGSRGLFRDNFSRFGIEIDFVDDANDPDAWRRLIRPTTRALFGESIANPRNELLDIPTVAAVAREHGIPLVIDNTLATPYLVRPLDLGANVVVHSTSKFLAGHGTSLGGVIIDSGRVAPTDPGGRTFVDFTRNVVAARLGPTLSPFNAFLLQQGIETLSLRIERHSSNALHVARWLEAQPEVESVDYAGLTSSPFHDIALRDYPRGQGSVFAFTLVGGEASARAFVDRVELFSRMTHLGDVRSLILHPGTTSHSQLSESELAIAGVGPGMLRVSIGIEDAPDLIRDLELGIQAVRALAAEPSDAVPRDATLHPDHAPLVHEHHLRFSAVSL